MPIKSITTTEQGGEREGKKDKTKKRKKKSPELRKSNIEAEVYNNIQNVTEKEKVKKSSKA